MKWSLGVALGAAAVAFASPVFAAGWIERAAPDSRHPGAVELTSRPDGATGLPGVRNIDSLLLSVAQARGGAQPFTTGALKNGKCAAFAEPLEKKKKKKKKKKK